MKTNYHLIIPSLLLTTALSTSVSAEDLNNGSVQSMGTASDKLATYLLNLGAFLGYDLTTAPPSSTPPSPLTDTTNLQNTEQGLFETVLGAIPVNSLSRAFVPSGNGIESINTQANATFTTPPYATPTQGSDVTANILIDQQPYQQDPVSQAVLNILQTPDYTYCMDYSGLKWTGGATGADGVANLPYPKCQYLYANLVTANIIGTTAQSGSTSVLPNPYDFFSNTYNQQFLSQLNSNTLIAPLLYSTTQSTGQSGSTTAQNGLPAQNQAQVAANFVRYASGSVIPQKLPSHQLYDTFYNAATSGSNDLAKAQAQATLSTYLVSLRVYAAQSSVGLSNLYYILSKRLPQNVATSTSDKSGVPPSSQALSEFNMATWRLFNADKSAKSSWLDQINQASSATVQKEMVTLLAEINYQLYLTRQQEERMLLTSSMLLLQNTRLSVALPESTPPS